MFILDIILILSITSRYELNCVFLVCGCMICKLSREGCQLKMTLNVGMLLAKCVHIMKRAPFPRSFLFIQLLAMECLDGHKNVKLSP